LSFEACVLALLQGLGNENDFFEPTLVKLKNMKAVQISCGFNHSGAILEEQ